MQRPSPRSAALLAGLALGLASCAPRPAQQPGGARLAARTGPLAELLSEAARQEGTPLARRARAWQTALPDCDEVEAEAGPQAGLEDLVSALRCRPARGGLEALHRDRGDDALAWVWPLADGAPLRGRVRRTPAGDVEAELWLPDAAASGLHSLLLPGDEPPGPPLLSGEQELLHARLRPFGGLDLTERVPAGGQADRMFRLRSRLFTGAVLDGTWEAAVYLPDEGAQVPAVALALGFSHRGAARAAVEEFVEALTGTWPLRRSFFAVGAAQGACLLELQILPEFAPCYVAAERALVFGWNPRSVRRALSGPPAPALDPRGGVRLDLSRVSEADARLARGDGTRLPAAAPRSAPGRWSQLRAAGERGEDGWRLELRLTAAKPGGDA
jgi:hypothetical protein